MFVNKIIQVMFPICIHPHHWILGHLNLHTMHLEVFDSYRSPLYEEAIKDKLVRFQVVLTQLIKDLRDRRAKMTRNFRWSFADDIPQQNSTLGDCGVWVCSFISDLAANQRPSLMGDPRRTAYQLRMIMVDAFYTRGTIVQPDE